MPEGRPALTSYHVRQARGGSRESLEWLVEKFSPLLLANARDEGEATVVVDGATRRIAAGTGAADPAAGLSVTLVPGDHEVTVKVPGEPEQSETLTLGADETWAVMIMPGSGYLADRVY